MRQVRVPVDVGNVTLCQERSPNSLWSTLWIEFLQTQSFHSCNREHVLEPMCVEALLYLILLHKKACRFSTKTSKTCHIYLFATLWTQHYPACYNTLLSAALSTMLYMWLVVIFNNVWSVCMWISIAVYQSEVVFLHCSFQWCICQSETVTKPITKWIMKTNCVQALRVNSIFIHL